MTSRAPRRLNAENVSFTIGMQGRADHRITVSLAYDRAGTLVEVAFSEAGKIGHGLSLLLGDLGIKLSRIIQNRDPETGAEQ